MIKAILVDDESHCNQSLKIELNEFCPEIDVIAEFTSAEEALEGIKRLKPDVLFLDIEMPWMNGFELLERLDNLNFEVIFITAYDSYAIEAFRYCAIDYLLKPIQTDLLQDAINKVVNKKNLAFNNDQLNALLHNLTKEKKNYKIVLPTSESLEVVAIEEIIRCKAENNYTYIFLKDGSQIFLAKSLKDIESIIQSNQFIRVHQSHLVNVQYIRKYMRSEGGYLLMTDGSQVSVSKANKERLINLIKSW